VQGERKDQYWDVDEAAWVAADGDPGVTVAADQYAYERLVLDAEPMAATRR